MINNERYLDEYKKEKAQLLSKGLQPTGINEHLESFIKYLEWKEKTKDLFSSDDLAKDLL